MAPTNFATIERSTLCDLFLEVGPDAPTLCEGWTTRDLAAHLVVREHRPDAALGIIASPIAAHGEKIRRKMAERPWEDLVATVRNGPPWWSPTRLASLDRLTNTNEFFIHHEDVRRAVDGWEPRVLDDDLTAQLGLMLSRMSKLMMRKAPTGVTVRVGSGDPIVARDAEPSVEISGDAGELMLFGNGRQAHARVELDGPADAVAALSAAQLGV